MKRSLLTALAVLVATATAAYAAPPTKTRGVLTVGFDVPAPGFVNGTATGTTIRNPTGFEVELDNAIAGKLGVSKVVWLRAPFAGLFSPAPKGYDFATEEITITPQRAKVVDFSAPYFDANQGVLVGKGVAVPKSLSDLKKLQTCAQATTTGLDYILHRLRPAKKPLVYQPSSPAAFDAVAAGQCDALVLDVPIVASERKKRPAGTFGPIAGQIITNEQYGALFQKGSRLRPLVDRAINELRADGTIGKLQAKWFGVNFSKVPILK